MNELEALDGLASPSRRAVAELAATVMENRPSAEIAAEVVELLRPLIPWAGISLSSYDPIAQRHRSIASAGYDKSTVRYLDASYLQVDPAYRWIVSTGRSYFSWETTGFDYSKTTSAINYWLPAGYSGGASCYLTTRDNRYVGNLHVSTEKLEWPSPRALQALCDISPMLTPLMDAWREPRDILHRWPDDTCGALISLDGREHAIPGSEPCSVSGQHQRLHRLAKLAVARSPRDDGLTMLGNRFPRRCWYLDDEPQQLEFVRCSTGWTMLHRPGDLPYKLTDRQIEVCSLTAHGMTNAQIAAQLGVRVGTVRRHLENIFDKTGLHSRTALSAAAWNEGLIDLHDLARHAAIT